MFDSDEGDVAQCAFPGVDARIETRVELLFACRYAQLTTGAAMTLFGQVADDSAVTRTLLPLSIRLRQTIADATVRLPARVLMRDGKALNVLQGGNGLVSCLLVHGFAENCHVWAPCVSSTEALVRSVAVDLRGHGDSDWDISSHYNVDTYASDVNDLLNLLGSGRHVLIGHSLGAEVLTHLTASHPEKVAALVLVDFGPNLSSDAKQRTRELIFESQRCYRTVAEYAQWLAETRPLVSSELVQHLAANSLRQTDAGFRLKIDPALLDEVETCSPQDESELWQILSAIECPVLVIRGAGSAMLSRESALRMQRILRNGRLVTVPAAGHGVMMDNPAGFNQAMIDFLRTFPH